jgi:hypothetical protein
VNEPRLLYKCKMCGEIFAKNYIGDQIEEVVSEEEQTAFVLITGSFYKQDYCRVCYKVQFGVIKERVYS